MPIFPMVRSRLSWLPLLFISLSTLACGFVGGAFGPNPAVTPTAVVPHVPITFEVATPSATPTLTPTSASTSQVTGPIEMLGITRPLPNQGVRGTIHIEGVSDATFEQQLGILVRDRNGNVISSATAKIQSPIGQRGNFSADVSIPAYLPTQPGRIIVYAVSARDGGPTHLASVEVQLNSDQPAAVAALDPNRAEAIVITEPALNAILHSIAKVSGISDPTSNQHLIVEVRGPSNETLGRVMATINAVAGQRGSFSVDVPLRVYGDPPGRVLVYSIHPRDGQTVHLSSVEVNLQP